MNITPAGQTWTYPDPEHSEGEGERHLIFAKQLDGKPGLTLNEVKGNVMQTEEVNEQETLRGTDTPKIYWEISCFLKESSFLIWKKLLLQNSISLPPSFLFIHESERLFIGCEERIFVIDVPSGKVIFEQELFAPFLTFYQLKEKFFNLDFVIALCELSLYAFDIFGNLKWESNFPDVLNFLRLSEDILELTDLSGTVYLLDILSGKHLMRKQQECYQ